MIDTYHNIVSQEQWIGLIFPGKDDLHIEIYVINGKDAKRNYICLF